MNVLSLFSGVGGLELGLERAGMTVVGQVEIDPFCRTVLAKHWPEVPKHDDVRSAVSWWRSQSRLPVDVVAGGVPCQPASRAGHQKHTGDARWLWPECISVIRELRPSFAILENVTGLLDRDGGFGDVLGGLAEIGYDTEWDCLPAAAFGAPHQRDRVFAVAYPAGERRQEILAAHGESGQGVLAQEAKDWGGDLRRGASGRVRLVPDAGLLGMVDGPASELDAARLRAIGNAVVPAVGEYVGRLVMASERAA